MRSPTVRALGWFGAANGAGAIVVFVYLTFVSQPASDVDERTSVVFVVYLLSTLVVGGLRAERKVRPVDAWSRSGRPPDDDERAEALALPWWFAREAFAYWALASVVFSLLNAVFGPGWREVARVLVGVLLGGVSTSALTYLLVERALRPLFGQALAGGSPPRTAAVGVRPKLVLSWALGSGIPLLGIALSPIGPSVDTRVSLPVLAGIGLVSGGLMVAIAARSVADRLEAVREALARVQAGDVSVEIPVDEGGEVGTLQAGFNAMVVGLRERQRLRDLFGRHVGDEVARHALERAGGLRGEQREVSVLFVDVIGSTTLASERPAAEVVATLNALFGAVVRIAAGEGGWVNKFEGDGALCVFGAPEDQPDHAARALRTALRLRDEVRALAVDHPDLDVGIGVSSGLAVAGNVGAEERYEYTVVGDPVNEAARLTEAAKVDPGRVLVSGPAVAAAGAAATGWQRVADVVLRGRTKATEVWRPVDPGDEAGWPGVPDEVVERPARAVRADGEPTTGEGRAS